MINYLNIKRRQKTNVRIRTNWSSNWTHLIWSDWRLWRNNWKVERTIRIPANANLQPSSGERHTPTISQVKEPINWKSSYHRSDAFIRVQQQNISINSDLLNQMTVSYANRWQMSIKYMKCRGYYVSLKTIYDTTFWWEGLS